MSETFNWARAASRQAHPWHFVHLRSSAITKCGRTIKPNWERRSFAATTPQEAQALTGAGVCFRCTGALTPEDLIRHPVRAVLSEYNKYEAPPPDGFDSDAFLLGFIQREPLVGNILFRFRYDLKRLRRIPADGWRQLLRIPRMGEQRILCLVNYCRVNGLELPWFAQWDADTAEIKFLIGLHREPALTEKQETCHAADQEQLQ